MLNFLVVKVPSVYNVILERSGLNTLHAIMSTYHLLMKFLTVQGVGKVEVTKHWLGSAMQSP